MDRQLRVAILGARGIGRVHARIWKDVGANVCAVLGSTENSSQQAATHINEILNVEATAYHDLHLLLEVAQPDIVSICTPPSLHFEQIHSVLKAGKAVFCEKPFFWSNEITTAQIPPMIESLRTYQDRKLWVCACNNYLLDCALERCNIQRPTSRFTFCYHTQGPYHGKDIAVDLLPHALPMLIQMFGRLEVTSITSQIDTGEYKAEFRYGDCNVALDFKQDPAGQKLLAIGLDDATFIREQEGAMATYKVFLHEQARGNRFEVRDPFAVEIERIKAAFSLGSAANDDLTHASEVLLMMSEILNH